ncbi:Vps54-like protein-domain-containing protein [Syncephalis fuscata]|nr:Vps54-like protein-domain-containing protein [Syncephalis fuscata]
MVDQQTLSKDGGRGRPLPPAQLHNVTAMTRARHSMDVNRRSTSHHEESSSWTETSFLGAAITPSPPVSPRRSQGRVSHTTTFSHNPISTQASRRLSNAPSQTGSIAESGGGGSINRPASLFRSGYLARGGHIAAGMSTAWSPETAFGRNAISSLLNAPNTKSKSAAAYLTSAWLPMGAGAAGGVALPRPETPPVQPTAIRRVRPEEFQSYLAGISEPWSDYEMNRSASERIARSLASNTLAEGDNQELIHLSAELPPVPVTELNTVPRLFFEEDFDLSDPSTFTNTLKLAAVALNREPDIKCIQPDLIDWYSQHLDTVESHLLREVALRSSSFFAALAALRNLHSQSTSSVTRTRELRSMLAAITRDRVLPVLNVIQQSRRREHLQQLKDAILLIQDTQRNRKQAADALTDGRAREAYKIAAKSRQRLVETFANLSPIVNKVEETDKRQIWIINHLKDELEKLELEARTAMEDELVRLVASYLNDVCAQSIEHTENKHNYQDEYDRIVRTCFLEDLARSIQMLAPATGFTITTMTALLNTIVMLANDIFIKNVTPDNRTEDILTTESLTSIEKFVFTDKATLTQKMQAMTLDAFIELLDTLYAHYAKLLKAVSHLQQTAYHTEEKNESVSEVEKAQEDKPHYLHVLLEQWSSLPQSATLAVHSRSKDFYRLLLPADTFVRQSCSWSRLSLDKTPFTKMLKTLAVGFLSTFHTERRRQSATLIAGEMWVACDVPPEFQQFADAIVSGHGELPTPTIAPTRTLKRNYIASSPPPSEKQIHVNSKAFYTVGGTLLIIKMLSEYLQCAHRIQVASHHVSRAVVDLLRMFNTRVNQMVLGAGAIQSAGLKNITAKHIALASQSLALVQILMPYLRINMAELAPRNKATQVMDDFDRLAKELSDHQDQLRSKLLEIMRDRVTRTCQRIEATDWDATDGATNSNNNNSNEELNPSRPMTELVKDTVTLHKVLTRFYPSEKVQDVLTAVVRNHSDCLESAYNRLTLRTSYGKRRLLSDARYFVTQLSALNSVRALGNQLEVAANNIKV